MSRIEVQNLPAETSPADADLLHLADSGDNYKSKKVTVANIRSLISKQVLLHDETLALAGSFDVSSISQDYDDLLILASLRGALASTYDYTQIFFNNDTTVANYHMQNNYWSNATSVGNSESATSRLSYIPAASAIANSFAHIRTYIQDYTSTNFLKIAQTKSTLAGITTQVWMWKVICIWEDGGATAINRIQIRTDNHPTDLIAADSRLRIIGIKNG